MPKTGKNSVSSKGTSGDFNKKKDVGGQKQKGKTTGSSRKGYNQANARGNLCYGPQAWAASSNLMCIIARVFNLTNISREDVSKIQTTEDFIKFVRNLNKDKDFWDGWVIAKISNGCTGTAKVIAGGNNQPTIAMKSSNLRMPDKRGSHVFYGEAMQANQYKGSLLLDDTELEALFELGLIPKKSQIDDVEFITTQEGTEISQLHFRLREAAQSINPKCRLPSNIAAMIRRKEDQDLIEMNTETSYDAEDLMTIGGQNVKGLDFREPDLDLSDIEEDDDFSDDDPE